MAIERGLLMENPKRRRITNRGLGDSGLRPRHVMPDAPEAADVAAAAPPSGPERARSEPERARSEKISTRRERTRSSRPPIRVDDVGAAAVAIASKAVRTSGVRLLKTRSELTNAPIDHRDAFVLSLIDGAMSVQALVDVSGFAEEEIVNILARLARLGIVSLP
jgi:hypothetical protein